MQNNLIMAAVLSVLMTGGSVEAEQAPTSQPRTTTTTTPLTPFFATIPAGSLPVSAWYKQSVYDTTNTKIGDIVDVLVSPIDGSVTAVIIGVGGFLGLGEKNIAVSFKEIKWTMRDNKNYPTITATTVNRH
jgi:hypothetical protein